MRMNMHNNLVVTREIGEVHVHDETKIKSSLLASVNDWELQVKLDVEALSMMGKVKTDGEQSHGS